MTTQKFYDTKADDLIIGSNYDDWIENKWGSDLVFGRGGDDMLHSTSRDDFVFFGGRGDDHAEINLVPQNWDYTVTEDGKHTTIEFFKETNCGAPKVMQTVELFGVESFHIHPDDPYLPW